MGASIFPADMRAAVRAQVATCAPADQVDPIVDIAFHAAEQALATMQRILNTAPSIAGETVATGIAASLLTTAGEALQEALTAQTIANGGRVERFEYQAGEA